MPSHNGNVTGPAEHADLLDHALSAAERAIELDPNNQGVRVHKATAHFFRKELDAFHAEADRALALRDDDAETLATLGYLFCQTGRYDRGVPMIKRAISLNPFQRNWYQDPMFRGAFLKGDYERALEMAQPQETAAAFWSFVYREVENAEFREMEAVQNAAEKAVGTVSAIAKGAYDAFAAIRIGDTVRLTDDDADNTVWTVTGRSFGTMTYDLTCGDAIAPDRTLNGVHVSFLERVGGGHTAGVKVMPMVPVPRPMPRLPEPPAFSDLTAHRVVTPRKIAR